MGLNNPGNPIVKKTLWAQPHYVSGVGAVLSATLNYYGCATLDNNQDDLCTLALAIPSDFVSVQKAVILLIGQWAGDVRISCNTEFAKNGELYNAHADGIAVANITLAVSTMYEYDIAAALTGLAAEDYLSVRLYRNGTNAGDTHEAILPVVGVLIEYL